MKLGANESPDHPATIPPNTFFFRPRSDSLSHANLNGFAPAHAAASLEARGEFPAAQMHKTNATTN